MRKAFPTAARVALHLAALVPLGVLIWRFSQGGLGANPIREVQLRTGDAAIDLLLACLSCTPIQIITGWSIVLSWRGTLGRYSLTYATLHFFNFLGIDYTFNLGLIRQDLFEKRYAVVGFAAFLTLLAVSLLSWPRFRRTCKIAAGRIKWLAYLAGGLAVWHYLWQAKIDTHWPVIYALILLILLFLRLPFVRILFRALRAQFAPGRVHKTPV
jgi:sulfoxide reductase heme-binding subunit YedZ